MAQMLRTHTVLAEGLSSVSNIHNGSKLSVTEVALDWMTLASTDTCIPVCLHTLTHIHKCLPKNQDLKIVRGYVLLTQELSW